MRRLLPSVLVGVVAIGALFAVIAFTAYGDESRTSWQPAGAMEGDRLTIAVWMGGCDDFQTVHVRETDTDVQLQAYVRHVRSECDSILRFEPHTVQLDAPLGERQLLGCNPPDSTNFIHADGVSNENCAHARPAPITTNTQ